MAYFPMFIDMNNLKVLLIGGGDIATHKLEKLIVFTQDITIITQHADDKIKSIVDIYHLTLHQRDYRVDDIRGFNIIVIATDSTILHKEIYEESRGLGILVNSVDNAKYCDFIFPSYIKKEDLTIAFSTGGTSPAFAKQLRQHFEKIIPNSVDDFLKTMKTLRTTLPKGKKRMLYLDKLVKEYFQKYFK